MANDAPYEYSTGDIVITKDGKEYKGEIVFSEYNKLKTSDFNIEADNARIKKMLCAKILSSLI